MVIFLHHGFHLGYFKFHTLGLFSVIRNEFRHEFLILFILIVDANFIQKSVKTALCDEAIIGEIFLPSFFEAYTFEI